jgi:hypothetical protein
MYPRHFLRETNLVLKKNIVKEVSVGTLDESVMSEDVPQALPKGKKACNICQKVLSAVNLSRHMKSHANNEKVYCHPCHQYFQNNQGFVNHCKSKKHKRLVTDDKDDTAPDSLLTSNDLSSESTDDASTLSRGQFFLVTFNSCCKYTVAMRIRRFYCAVCDFISTIK